MGGEKAVEETGERRRGALARWGGGDAAEKKKGHAVRPGPGGRGRRPGGGARERWREEGKAGRGSCDLRVREGNESGRRRERPTRPPATAPNAQGRGPRWWEDEGCAGAGAEVAGE